jgi:hypothetical protein
MKYSQQNNPKRHKLIRDRNFEIATPAPIINTLEELKEHLKEAIRVEHFTIPPYLCALYSIKEGSNEVAARIIRTVVVEEMLHMVMAANILNAVGGSPVINAKEVIPQFPNPLPRSAGLFKVGLLKFSKEAINTFLRIEKPAGQSAQAQTDKFNSIGQFYAAIREALVRLDKETKGGIFTGDPKKQVGSEHYYGSGGKLIAVYKLEDALEAIEEIVGQGEGIDDTINDADDLLFADDVEFAHYFRFNEIFHERYYKVGDKPQDNPSGPPLSVDWSDVHNMQPNPKMAHYSDPWVKEKALQFNKTYMRLLDNIHDACNGNPNALLQGLPLMYKLKEQAVELMKIPSGDGNYMAGPSFEYVP